MEIETKEKVLSASKTLLILVGALGFVFVAAAMGNAVQLLKYTPIMKKSKLKVYEINRGIKRLLERGLIEINEDEDSKYLEITNKGKHLLFKYELEGLVQNKPKKWDKKYRVVIFDIAENKRGIRDQLRVMIRGFGFICLQQSVWIYPYPCQDIIGLLKEYLGLRGEVLYLTVDSIENDKWLKEDFKLT